MSRSNGTVTEKELVLAAKIGTGYNAGDEHDSESSGGGDVGSTGEGGGASIGDGDVSGNVNGSGVVDGACQLGALAWAMVQVLATSVLENVLAFSRRRK